MWLGLFEPGEEELAQVRDTFGLHELAVEDAQNVHMRPKIELYDQDVPLVISRTARYDDAAEEVEFGEVSVFLAPTFVITVRQGVASGLRGAQQRPELLAAGSSSALWAILDQVVDGYAPVVAGLERRAGRAQQTRASSTPSPSASHDQPDARLAARAALTRDPDQNHAAEEPTGEPATALNGLERRHPKYAHRTKWWPRCGRSGSRLSCGDVLAVQRTDMSERHGGAAGQTQEPRGPRNYSASEHTGGRCHQDQRNEMGEPIALGDIALCQHGHHQVPQRPGEIALSDHDGPLTHTDLIDGVARAHPVGRREGRSLVDEFLPALRVAAAAGIDHPAAYAPIPRYPGDLKPHPPRLSRFYRHAPVTTALASPARATPAAALLRETADGLVAKARSHDDGDGSAGSWPSC